MLAEVKVMSGAGASPNPASRRAGREQVNPPQGFDPWSDQTDMTQAPDDPWLRPTDTATGQGSTTASVDRIQSQLRRHFEAAFGDRESMRLRAMLDAAEQAIAVVARTDAPYHNCEHTLLVCLVGQQILRGKQALGDPVSAQEWVHYIVSLLFHDIGYVKNLLPGDIEGSLVSDGLGGWRQLPSGATDAFLTPIHVDRGVAHVRRLFAHNPWIDAEILATYIESTRFPVPDGVRNQPRSRFQWQDLVRSADLIGQLADPAYLQKLPALYEEFVDCGRAQADGLSSYRDLVARFPQFYRQVVDPLVGVGFEALNAHAEGRRWGTSLRATIAQCESG